MAFNNEIELRSAMTANQTRPQIPQVMNAVNRVEGMFEECASAVHALLARLAPVIRSEAPCKDPPRDNFSTDVVLANRLHEISDKIQVLTVAVRSHLDRIEV